jgi:very-short-patch-repair endonuclease
LQKAIFEKAIPPFHTQKYIPLFWCEPDFTWDEEKTILDWDGPPHDKESQASKDALQNEYLARLGWKVIRVHYDGKKTSQADLVKVLGWVKDILTDSRYGHVWHYDLDGGLDRLE